MILSNWISFKHKLVIIWASFVHYLDIIWTSFGHHLDIELDYRKLVFGISRSGGGFLLGSYSVSPLTRASYKRTHLHIRLNHCAGGSCLELRVLTASTHPRYRHQFLRSCLGASSTILFGGFSNLLKSAVLHGCGGSYKSIIPLLGPRVLPLKRAVYSL